MNVSQVIIIADVLEDPVSLYTCTLTFTFHNLQILMHH